MLPELVEPLLTFEEPFIILEDRLYTLTKELKQNYLYFHGLKLGMESSESIKYLETQLSDGRITKDNRKNKFSITYFFEEVVNEYTNIKQNRKARTKPNNELKGSYKKLNNSILTNILGGNKGIFCYDKQIYSLNLSGISDEYVKFEGRIYSLNKFISSRKFKQKYSSIINTKLVSKNNCLTQTFPRSKRNLLINKVNNSNYQIISRSDSFILKQDNHYYKFPSPKVYTVVSINNSLLTFTKARVKGKYKHPLTNFSAQSRSICHGPFIKQYWRDNNVSFNTYKLTELYNKMVPIQVAKVLITGENLLKKGVTKKIDVHRELNRDNFKEFLISCQNLAKHYEIHEVR